MGLLWFLQKALTAFVRTVFSRCLYSEQPLKIQVMSSCRAKGQVSLIPLKKIWIASIQGFFPVNACEEVCCSCGEPADRTEGKGSLL